MNKVPGWHAALSALIVDRLQRPFEWGAHDCCLFAADAVALQLGEDPAAPLRGAYRTADQALRLLGSLGGLRGVARAALGDEVHPLLARLGDVVLVQSEEQGERESLAVCVGTTAMSPGEHGLEHVPQARWRAAWHVGGGLE